MPQMAPLNWIMLYTFFINLFILIIIMNYYMFLYSPKSFKINKKNLINNWKW